MRITYTGGCAGHEDQAPKISRSLVAQSARGVDQSCYSIRLDRASNQGGTPGCYCTSSLFRFEELFLGIGCLGTMIGIAEYGRENAEGSSVGEKSTCRNCGGLD